MCEGNCQKSERAMVNRVSSKKHILHENHWEMVKYRNQFPFVAEECAMRVIKELQLCRQLYITQICT